MKLTTLAAASSTLFAFANAAVDPIVIKGSKFFYKTNGTQFYMKGVAYQQGISSNTSQTSTLDIVDPLADATSCKRDIPNLQKLQTNTIRVYALDPTQNHDDCMNALADAGIYVLADLSQPGQSINRDTPQWTTDLYQRYTSVVDMMAKYDNTFGFFAGNEVSNSPNNTGASAFVKAAVRDTKAYIKQKNYRQLGVGYATNDDANIRVNLASFFDCGDNRDDAIDFWGYNIYSWCGNSSFTEAGYDVRTKEFETYNVPAFFAEYGCNQVRPRLFTEVEALYGPQMNDIWSGGIVYMYFEEANQFGLVTVNGNNVETNDDFDNLSAEIAKVTATGINMNDYTPTNTAAASCPSVGSDWAAVATPLPPTANADACSCMMSTLKCTVKSSVSEKSYSDLFGFVCGVQDGKYCAGINTNVTSGGSYGAYGMCNSTQQLAFVLDAYNKGVGDCDFSGSATAVQAAATTAASCSALLNQAGVAGTGTVTSAPTGTGAGSGSSAGSSKGAAPGLSAPGFDTGLLGLGLYVSVAAMAGMGMVLL